MSRKRTRTAIPPDAQSAADVAVVLVAAGSGTRFGSDKTQLLLGGKPLWRWSYDLFRSHPAVGEIVLVGGSHLQVGVTRVEGGKSRQESSRLGVGAVSPASAYILIHDAARPVAGQSGRQRRSSRLSIHCVRLARANRPSIGRGLWRCRPRRADGPT